MKVVSFSYTANTYSESEVGVQWNLCSLVGITVIYKSLQSSWDYSHLLHMIFSLHFIAGNNCNYHSTLMVFLFTLESLQNFKKKIVSGKVHLKNAKIADLIVSH